MKLGMLKICAHWRFLSEIWVFRFHRNAWNRRKSLKMCFPYVFLSCELGRMKKLGCTSNTCPSLFFHHKFLHLFEKSATWGIVAVVTIKWDATRWAATRWVAIRWITTRWITTRWVPIRWPTIRWATIRWLAIRWVVVRFGVPSTEPWHFPWKVKCFVSSGRRGTTQMDDSLK